MFFFRRFYSKLYPKFGRKFGTETPKEEGKKLPEKGKEDKKLIKDVQEEQQLRFPLKKVNVSIQGANCRAGYAAALLLKQHPLIKKIYLHDNKLDTCIASDLNAIDSSPKVEAFCGTNNAYSLRAADVTVLLDTDRKEESMEKKYELSYFRVKKFAEICSLHCPKSVMVVCVDPLCCMMKVVQSILEETPFYHPSRLLGCVSTMQSIVNTIAANNLNLNPTSVHVPLLGGPDAETCVPVISLMTPDPGLSLRDQYSFYEMIKRELVKAMFDMSTKKSTMTEGYCIGRIIIACAKGMNGHDDALSCVLARTSQTYPLKYLVSTVKFGLDGIFHNYGIPKLSKFELEELEKSLLLQERQANAMSKTYEKLNNYVKGCCS